MLDVEELLRELNEVLNRHEARMFVMGHDLDAWINHKTDRWTHEAIRLHFYDGEIHDVKELY